MDAIKDRAQQLVDEDGVDETTIDWLEEQYAALQDELTGTTTQEEVVDEEGQPVEEDTPATEDIYASLQHGERIGTFSGIEQNRFNELVGKGEMAIASGEFFLAEKRFKQALMFIPGHPMATAGLGHANLGSGLYLSASHVLQSLFTFQPEMIDVMYEPQLSYHRESIWFGLRLRLETGLMRREMVEPMHFCLHTLGTSCKMLK